MPYPDRQPSRRPAPRPSSRRQPPPPGPATIAPTEPTSPRHRRDSLKATYRRLAKLARVPVATLVAADHDRLVAIAAAVEPVDGQQGDARRLVMKVARLRGAAPAGASAPSAE